MVVYYVRPKEKFQVPVECRYLRPDKFSGKSLEEIYEFIAYEGGVKRKLGDLFDIEGPSSPSLNPEDIELRIKDAEKIRYLGYRMTSGTLIVEGDVGSLAGYRMRGGNLIIEGNAGSWLGARMRGGNVEVKGSAGDFIGAAFVGDKPGYGMRKGKILVRGDAGSNIGAGMKSGAIIVLGNASHLIGAHMVGGSIFIGGNAGKFVGARAQGGKIVIGGKVDGLLPSFYIDDVVNKAKVKEYKLEKEFLLFRGDSVVDGKARLYIARDANPEISSLKDLLVAEV
ncbi:MAG: formylmethanofuran dehydrogenase subunit C [Candidatus Korarchaeota archaeon]|nr:formylmethanofuran dehydrogenase subunit C [Candidatus Korarchaeota archaeon]